MRENLLFTNCSGAGYNRVSTANNNKNKSGEKMKTLLRGGLCCITLIPVLALAGWQHTNSTSAMQTESMKGIPTDAFHQSNVIEEMQPFFLADNDIEDASIPATQKAVSRNANFKPEAKSATITMLTLEPGTLKENLERINQTLPKPWRIIWVSENDYSVTGYSTVTGDNFYDAIGKVLNYYPVRAEFYTKNHVLSIVPGNA